MNLQKEDPETGLPYLVQEVTTDWVMQGLTVKLVDGSVAFVGLGDLFGHRLFLNLFLERAGRGDSARASIVMEDRELAFIVMNSHVESNWKSFFKEE